MNVICVRNLARCLIAMAAFASSLVSAADAPANAASSWITLLDGAYPQTLTNWNRIGVDNWRIEDGAVVADKLLVNDSNFLITKQSYGDFKLTAEFWIDDKAHAAMLLRCLDPYRVHPRNSYVINLDDNDANYGTGSIVNFVKVSPALKVSGHWNTLAVTAQGTHIVVAVNGTKTIDMVDSTFPAGLLALQYSGGVVKWRKVLIQPL